MKNQTDYDDIIAGRAAAYAAQRRADRWRALRWLVYFVGVAVGIPAAMLIIDAIASSAHAAEYTCDQPIVTLGKVGTNPATSVDIAYDHATGWRVTYTLANGRTIDRGDQYAMTDRTDAGLPEKASWGGALNRDPKLYMTGALNYNGDGSAYYDETLVDRAHGNNAVMNSVAACHAIGTPEPIVAQTPAPAPTSRRQDAPIIASGDEVPFVYNNTGGMVVTALVGGYSTVMLVDTGAAIPKIPAALADRLIAEGRAQEGHGGDFVLADGSTRHDRTVIVDSLTVGGYRSSDVEMSVGTGDAILGLSVMRSFGTMTINHNHDVLSFS